MDIEQIGKLVEFYHNVGIFGLGIFIVFFIIDIMLFFRLRMKEVISFLRKTQKIKSRRRRSNKCSEK